MSDTDRDVVLNAGTGGANIASEYSKYGGVTAHFQMVKPVHGASGTINAVSDAAPWPSVLRGGGSNNKLTTSLLAGSNDTFDVNIRGQSGANNIATNITKFAGIEIGTAHGLPIANVGSTAGIFLAVAGNTLGGPITVTGGTGGFNIRSLTGGTAGYTYDNTAHLDFVVVQGVTGAYPVGITFGSVGDALLVKFPANEGLSAGIPGGSSAAPHSVAVQGMINAFPVGVTAGSSADTGLFIRGLTHSVDSVVVHGYDGAVEVGVTAGAGGFNIRGLTGARDVVGIVGWGAGGTVSPGTTLDIRNLVSTRDTVGVTGSGLYGTIATMIVGRTGENVGVSGDALKVSLVDATINATVNVGADIEVTNDAGNPLYVQGTTAAGGRTRHWIGTTGDIGITVSASNLDIRNLESQIDSVRIIGTTGSYSVGITAGSQFGGQPGLNVRRLDGGTAGFTGSLNDGTPDTGYINIDTVAIQGICGGLAVGITAGGVVANGLTIRPLTTTSDAITVHGSTGSYDLGVTAGSQISGNDGLNVRRLYGGTYGYTGDQGTTGYSRIDTVAVQGICGGYPVGITTGSNQLSVVSTSTNPVIVKGVSGPYGALPVQLFSAGGTAFGMSSDGESLRVSIADANIQATVTIDTSVEIRNDTGNPIPISGGNTAAVRIEGSTGSSVVPISIVGATTWGPPIRIAGVTTGTPVWVSNQLDETFDITDITGTVTLPTGAAKDATLSDTMATLGSTLGILGVTLDMILDKLPGGAINVDPLNALYILPSSKQVDNIDSDTNAIMGSASTAATNTGTIAGAVDSAKMKVKIAVGDIAVPTSFVTGSKDVNASSVQITTTPTTLSNGINIKGHPRNEDHIWVTQDDNANNGYPLGAGEELFLDISNLNKVYVYADQTGLTACYIYR
jgi:hypothetical protein